MLARFDLRGHGTDPKTEITAGVTTFLTIADGIGLGVHCYVGGKLLAGRYSQCPPAVWFIAGLFALRFALL